MVQRDDNIHKTTYLCYEDEFKNDYTNLVNLIHSCELSSQGTYLGSRVG